jgi:chromosome segregation ATPase
MAQRIDTDLRELTDLVKGLGTKLESLDRKIEALDRKTEQAFVGVDKKIEKGFSDADKKIEALDKKIDLGFQELDKKIDLKFAETEASIQALSKKTELSFSEVNGKLDVVNARLIGIDEKIKTSDVNITKLDTRIWAFGGFALTVSVGSLLTVFIRFLFMNSPNF